MQTVHSWKTYKMGLQVLGWGNASRMPYAYVIWFQPYQGQQGSNQSEYKSLGLGASIVLQFADELQKIDSKAPFSTFHSLPRIMHGNCISIMVDSWIT